MRNSKIEWCDHTFNPWMGCTAVSPGCDHCYAEAKMDTRLGRVKWGAGQPRVRTSEKYWITPLRWNVECAVAGTRARVFCASLADVFDNEVDPRWRRDLFRLIMATPHLDWLLLTKRIGNARIVLEAVEGMALGLVAWPLRNVWIGATVVNQDEADRDIPKLLAVPAAVRFLSIEPMLGPIDLVREHDVLCRCGGCINMARQFPDHAGLQRIDWVICGGESGPHARPMHIGWARRLAQQCKAAGVPFFMKQLGARPSGWCAAQAHAGLFDRDDDSCDFYEAHEQAYPCEGRCAAMKDRKGADMAEWPEDLRIREVPHA